MKSKIVPIFLVGSPCFDTYRKKKLNSGWFKYHGKSQNRVCGDSLANFQLFPQICKVLLVRNVSERLHGNGLTRFGLIAQIYRKITRR